MKELNIEELEALINSKIEKLKRKIINYEDMAKPVKPENSIGRISRMDAINNKSVFEATLRQAKNELKALYETLNNLHKEDFGLCRKCKQNIPLGRIVLKPDVPYCVNCAK